jgi:N,N'-diacetyllegionaminate synthase
MRDHYIFAETAFHHEGDINYMMRLIEEVSASAATGIKFQVLTRPLDFISSKHKDYSQLRKYCFSLTQWRKILQRAVDVDLDLVVMPLNIEALKLCEEFPVKWIEIHSVSQNDWRLKQKVKDNSYKLIITTGGRFVDEVEQDISYFEGNVEIIMVGFQAFPSNLSDVRIGQIAYWKRRYSNLHIGYADHSFYSSDEAINSLEFAFLLGARIFEKHVSLQPGVERVDYSAAVSIKDIANIQNKLTFLEKHIIPERMNPDDFTNEEMVYRKRQLICVATRDLEIGEILKEGDVALKMHHQTSNSFDNIQELLGKKLKCKVETDCLFEPHLFD